MSRWHSYLNSAREILGVYEGQEPLASFLKKHFSAHKKFGATDRKLVSHLCYCYFRTGKSFSGIPVEERILAGLFLASEESNKLLAALKPEWDQQASLPVKEKIALVNQPGLIDELFPWTDELSNEIEKEGFVLSHLRQPDLFLRLRPGKEAGTRQKLRITGISFTDISETCLALPNSTKVEEIIRLDDEAVVQDFSSQRMGELLGSTRDSSSGLPARLSVWDCCAASGGKSIMAKDLLGDIDLTVSDIRGSILANLKKRFSVAGIENYKAMVVDLVNDQCSMFNDQFSIILADVPCTGSGTWSRTPEQLYFFSKEKIDAYTALQKKIVTAVVPHIGPCGYLLYSTCSVFKKENEEMADFIKEKFHLQLEKMELIKGYADKADSMFAVLFKRAL